jgi:nucleoside 2-deoxyribosyltransferase
MRIYLASRYSRLGELRGYRAELEAADHLITARWLDGHEIDGAGLSAREQALAHARFAEEDVADIVQADCLVFFAEPPSSTGGRHGARHVELGIALGLGKRVVVVGHRETVFVYLPEVEVFASWEEARAALNRADGRDLSWRTERLDNWEALCRRIDGRNE